MDKVARVDAAKCVGCEACIFVCPVGVLEMADTKCLVREGCTGCGACVDICNWKAITMEAEGNNGGV